MKMSIPDQNDILLACKEVRKNFEENQSIRSKRFPTGWCGDASVELKKVLKRKFGIDADLCSGDLYPSHEITRYNHMWLEYENYIIDITADQFNHLNFNNPAVMVTSDRTFHEKFQYGRKVNGNRIDSGNSE
ncbi:hypothetical protein SMZ84_001941 [Cronobacter turicensis]|nr:hypothetical protein [Cronobacter turicensis]